MACIAGSHSPLGDRRAACAARHSPGGERANSRQRRDSRVFGCFVRRAHDWVRIRRSEIGERLAQRDILQAESERILAKGEIPVIRFSLALLHQKRGWSSTSYSILFFCCPVRGISPGNASLAACIAGSHSPLGDRRAARAARHFPAASVRILAKGEIPVIRFSLVLLHQT